MKTKHVFTTLAFSALLGLGTLAGLRLGAKEVKKASATDLLYLDFGTIASHWNDKLKQTQYSDNPGTWAYFFNATTVGNDWPGYLMDHVEGNVYSVTKQEAEHVIFNVMGWQGDCQTVNLDIPNDKNLFTINTSYTSTNSQNGVWSVYEEPTPEPEPDYYVKVAAGEYTKMTYVKDFTYDETKTGKEYTATISGTEGQKVFFKANSTEIHPGASDGDLKNNLFYRNDNQQITIVQDATDETLTLKVYENGYDSFLTGYVAAPRTIYFTNNKGWSGVPNYYAYDANGKEIAAWPGTAMTFVEYDQYSQPVYRFSMDATKFTTLIICNEAGTEQTENILLASYSQNGFYLQDKAEGVYPISQYTYAAVERSVWVGGVEYELKESESQPEDSHLLMQLETKVAIDMKHNDQIRLKVGDSYNDNCLQPYYSNNATYDGQYMRVVKEVVDKVYVKLMDDASTKIFVGGLNLTKQGYHVLVNGQDVIEMTHKGVNDEEFDEYYTESTSFAEDDVLRFINANTENAAPVVFDITNISTYGVGYKFDDDGQGHLKCVEACTAAVYLKLKFEADEVYFGEVEEYIDEAINFALNFKDDLASACSQQNKQTAVEAAWEEAAAAYKATGEYALSAAAKAELKKADSTVKEIREFVERYIGIKKQHSDWDLDNFLEIDIPASANYSLHTFVNNNAMLIVVIAAGATICGLALLLSLKKRKHQ